MQAAVAITLNEPPLWVEPCGSIAVARMAALGAERKPMFESAASGFGPEADLDELGERFCVKSARPRRAPEFFLGVVNSVAGKLGPSCGTIVEGRQIFSEGGNSLVTP